MSLIVQEGVMQREVPVLPGLEVATYSRPARFIGGDFVRYVEQIELHRLGILIGDVSGKGIPAALVMAVVVCLFNERNNLAKLPDQLLSDINIALKQFLGARSRFNSSALWVFLICRKSASAMPAPGTISRCISTFVKAPLQNLFQPVLCLAFLTRANIKAKRCLSLRVIK